MGNLKVSLLVLISAIFQEVHGQDEEGCIGPFLPPIIHNFSYTESPLFVEAGITSDSPMTLTWQIREYYKDWPRYKYVDHYIPDNGDDQFEVFQETSNNTTLIRISGKPFDKFPVKLQLQISVQHPCNTLQYIANVITLKRLAEGLVQFPIVNVIPKPEYIVTPGDELKLLLHVSFRPGIDYNALYRFARHLKHDADGSELSIDQRLEERDLYNFTSPNMSYPMKLTQELQHADTFKVSMAFDKWSAADSGVYVVSFFTGYSAILYNTVPYGAQTAHMVRAFFDLRSHMFVPLSIFVYSEVDWIFRKEPDVDSDGTYILHLPRFSNFSTSVRCIAYGYMMSNPTLETTALRSGKWRPFLDKSTIIRSRPYTAEALHIRENSTQKYTCRTYTRDELVTLTFKSVWYTPVKIIDWFPESRYIRLGRVLGPLVIKCTGKGSENALPFMRFHLLNATQLTVFPKDKTYLADHQDHELTASSPGVRMSMRNDLARGRVTGTLTVYDLGVVRGQSGIRCYVGDMTGFDTKVFWLGQ